MPIRRIGEVLQQEAEVTAAQKPLTPLERRQKADRDTRRYNGLIEMLDNISTAREFVAGMDFVDFLSDRKTKYAVIMCLTIIGKRLRFISLAERKKIPEVPWRSIQATVRIAAKQEWGVVERLIWETLEDDLPTLKRTLELLVKDMGQKSSGD
jgi:uncharacterized protein with HEPN domain